MPTPRAVQDASCGRRPGAATRGRPAGVTGLLVGKLLGCLAAGVVLGVTPALAATATANRAAAPAAGCSHPAAAALWAARGAGRGGNPAGSRPCPVRSAKSSSSRSAPAVGPVRVARATVRVSSPVGGYPPPAAGGSGEGLPRPGRGLQVSGWRRCRRRRRQRRPATRLRLRWRRRVSPGSRHQLGERRTARRRQPFHRPAPAPCRLVGRGARQRRRRSTGQVRRWSGGCPHGCPVGQRGQGQLDSTRAGDDPVARDRGPPRSARPVHLHRYPNWCIPPRIAWSRRGVLTCQVADLYTRDADEREDEAGPARTPRATPTPYMGGGADGSVGDGPGRGEGGSRGSGGIGSGGSGSGVGKGEGMVIGPPSAAGWSTMSVRPRRA